MASELVGDGSRRPVRPHLHNGSAALLRWTSVALVVTVWVSATVFGVYILAFYAGAVAEGDMQRWNNVLPRIYERTTPVATTGIGLHFAAGGSILILGCIQLIGAICSALRWHHGCIC